MLSSRRDATVFRRVRFFQSGKMYVPIPNNSVKVFSERCWSRVFPNIYRRTYTTYSSTVSVVDQNTNIYSAEITVAPLLNSFTPYPLYPIPGIGRREERAAYSLTSTIMLLRARGINLPAFAPRIHPPLGTSTPAVPYQVSFTGLLCV